METVPNDRGLGRYADAAWRAAGGQAVCATGSAFGARHYDNLGGLPGPAVAASIGCGNPAAVADLHPGDIVLDLG